MSALSGFLVVTKKLQLYHNELYRGIHRIPPFDQNLYNRGFDDPYLWGEYVTESGLFPDLQTARSVKQVYAPALDPDDLEIIYVSEEEQGSPSNADLEFLGYDVASNEFSFWSVVGDFSVNGRLNATREKLNEHGLFASRADAGRYLKEYRRLQLPHYEVDDLTIWSVWLVGDP